MKLKYLALALCGILHPIAGFAQTDSPPPPPPKNEPEMEARTWLGVATSEVPPVLSQHLDLKEGFGILISHIPEGSPAEQAGLKAGDVLTMLDDQILTTPEHLAILVKSKKKGDKADLTYIRKGAEQKTSVTLDEKEMPAMDRHRPMPQFGSGSPEQWQDWGDEMRKQGEQFHRRMQEMQQNQMQQRPRFDQKGRPGDMKAPKPEATERRDHKHNAPQPILQNESTVKIDNDHGAVVISQKNGKGSITITDAEGKEVFSGAFDSEKGIKSLPENAQDKLKEMKVDTIDMFSPTPVPVMPKPAPKQDPAKDTTGEPL